MALNEKVTFQKNLEKASITFVKNNKFEIWGWKPHIERINIRSFSTWKIALSCHMGSTFSKNVEIWKMKIPKNERKLLKRVQKNDLGVDDNQLMPKRSRNSSKANPKQSQSDPETVPQRSPNGPIFSLSQDVPLHTLSSWSIANWSMVNCSIFRKVGKNVVSLYKSLSSKFSPNRMLYKISKKPETVKSWGRHQKKNV